MAKITITFTDGTKKGDVNISTEFEPEIHAKGRPTPAQSAAFICLDAITKSAKIKE